MARSHYIYIVIQDYPCDSYELKSAFTVKHELVSWAKNNDNCELKYLRIKDGKSDEPQDITQDIRNLINGQS